MALKMSASAVLGKYNLSDLQELLTTASCSWLQSTDEFHFPVEYPKGLTNQMKDFSYPNAVILVPVVPDAPLNYKEVQQILRELVMGIYILNQVPIIYLDGNYDCSTTCLLSPAYHDTRIGQILINVDYNMKALWHGAYMPTEKRKRFSEVWRSNLAVDVNGSPKAKEDILSEFLKAGLVDISTDPDFEGIYSADVYLDPTYDPNSCMAMQLFMQHVNNILLQINPHITCVKQHQNLFMYDAAYTLSNAVRLTEEEIDLVTYQKLQQRLILQQKLIEKYLARKAEVHTNITYLKLIAFLIPFLIALKGKRKVPDLSRLLPPFSDDKLKTERELPPLLLGPDFKCKHFLYETNEYFHLHGGIEFDIGTPALEDVPEHIKIAFNDIQTQAVNHLKQLFKPDMLLRGQYTIPIMQLHGKSYYVISVELENLFQTFQKVQWWGAMSETIRMLKSDKLPLNGVQLNEQLKKKIGHKNAIKCKDLSTGLIAATKSGLTAVFHTYCQQNPISQLRVVNEAGYALVHHAAIHNHVSIICQLTTVHLKVNQRRSDNFQNSGPTGLHMAAKCGSLGVLTCLLALRADHTKVDQRGWTAMHFAAFYDNVSCIRALYRKDPSFLELETSAEYRSTPLLLAAMAGAFDAFQYLLSLGANLTKIDSERNNIVHLAALYSHTEILKYIIKQNIPELQVWKLLKGSLHLLIKPKIPYNILNFKYLTEIQSFNCSTLIKPSHFFVKELEDFCCRNSDNKSPSPHPSYINDLVWSQNCSMCELVNASVIHSNHICSKCLRLEELRLSVDELEAELQTLRCIRKREIYLDTLFQKAVTLHRIASSDLVSGQGQEGGTASEAGTRQGSERLHSELNLNGSTRKTVEVRHRKAIRSSTPPQFSESGGDAGSREGPKRNAVSCGWEEEASNANQAEPKLSIGEQVIAEIQGTSMKRTLLEQQWEMCEILSTFPEAVHTFGKRLEQTISTMSTMMSRALALLFTSLERVATCIENQMWQTTECILVLTYGLLQYRQWPPHPMALLVMLSWIPVLKGPGPRQQAVNWLPIVEFGWGSPVLCFAVITWTHQSPKLISESKSLDFQKNIRTQEIGAAGDLTYADFQAAARTTDEPGELANLHSGGSVASAWVHRSMNPKEMLQSNEYKKQEMGVRSLEVLCVIKKQYWKPIHSAGSIPALIDLLRSKHETLQCIAAAVLCNLSTYPTVCHAIVNYDIIPVLIELLHSQQPELQSRCSVILYDIAQIEDNGSLIASLGAIPPLVKILNSEVEDVLVNVIKCIRILCRNNPVNQTLVANEGAIPLLVELLSVASDVLQSDASVALAEVARGHKWNQDAIVAEGAVGPLIHILSGRKIKMQLKAITAVEVLAERNAAIQKEFLEMSADKHILKLLKVFEIEIREQAATAMWALAGKTLTQREKMAKEIGYSLVIDLLLSSSDKMHNVACQALIALSECNKEQQDKICAENGIPPLVRLLRSSKISLHTLLSAITALGTLCVGVAHVNNPISQRKITEEDGMDVLLYLLYATNSPQVQVEVIYSLACIVLGNNELQKVLMERKGFTFKIILNHLKTAEKDISLRAGSALALFAFNNTKQELLIREYGGIEMSVFNKFLQSAKELDQAIAAFQIIILAKVIVDMDEVTLSAMGIITLINLLKSEKPSTIIVVGQLLSSLTQTRTGISDAIITMGAVEHLCPHLYAEREQVRDSCATALGYLSFNRTGHRRLLVECRNQPELYELLISNICKDGKISKEFTDEFRVQKLVGLPSERLEISEGQLVVVKADRKGKLSVSLNTTEISIR
ncbi:ankyrin and armadillo repeat-containing protein [Heterodontus francisci]|uniref:ankyrin and armadillo repeat-containing protein n=1 Tax=Heterodontus francisci TaxID=7792 RepID=UPI00355B6909